MTKNRSKVNAIKNSLGANKGEVAGLAAIRKAAAAHGITHYVISFQRAEDTPNDFVVAVNECNPIAVLTAIVSTIRVGWRTIEAQALKGKTQQVRATVAEQIHTVARDIAIGRKV